MSIQTTIQRGNTRLWAHLPALARHIRRPRGLSAPSVAALSRVYLDRCGAALKLSTCSTYEGIVERYILPEFGPVPVTELTAERINGFLRDKVFPTCGEGIAPSTAKSIVTVLRGILRCAEERGWAAASCGSILRPAGAGAEARVLSEGEQRRLKEYCLAELDEVKLGVLLCLYTGLRVGEVCALKWGDVSRRAGTITVRRTVQRIKNPEYSPGSGQSKTRVIFDAPKSKCANRCIPIPSRLAGPLERFRRDADCFLLTGQAEVWLEPRAMQHAFRRILEDAGIGHINFHALRHTFATNCVNRGFDAKALSRILGHSDVGITLNTYVHPSVSVLRSYMDRLD